MTDFHRQAFKKQIEAKPTHYSSISLIEKCSTRYDNHDLWCFCLEYNLAMLYFCSSFSAYNIHDDKMPQ